MEALADAVFAEGGGVDVLHNNAGIGHAGPVEEIPLSDWRRVVEINLMGVVHGICAFVPRMLAQGRPSHIVNTASALGLIPGIDLAPYATTKHAVVGLSESLHAELAGRGIGVTALCPGIISTAIVSESTMRGEIGKSKQGTVDFYANRGTSPDVVADAVVTAIRKRRPVQPVPELARLPELDRPPDLPARGDRSGASHLQGAAPPDRGLAGAVPRRA